MSLKSSSSPLEPQQAESGRSLWRRPSFRATCGWGTALLTSLAFAVPVDFVTEEPGPTFNTIGDYDGKQLIEIDGTQTYPVSGQLDMTTVSVAGGPNTTIHAVQTLSTWLMSSTVVVPTDVMYAPTVTNEQVSSQNTADMMNSQELAQAAALNYLGKDYEEKLTVTGTAENSAVEGQVQEGDVLLKIAGQPIDHFEDIAEILKANGNNSLTLTVERDGKETTLEATPRYDETSKTYLLGMYLKRDYTFPFTVTYGLEEVGGPSAGMMFALGIIDETTEDDMTGGKHFAGTGTISVDGSVGAIGGIAQKMVGAKSSGAEIFLAPEANCDEVVGHVPDGLSVIKVSTLTEAAEAVTAIGDGADPASFPTCG